MTALAIALGGGIGSWCRYAIARKIVARHPSLFPLPTLVVNVVGSAILGALVGAFAVDQTAEGWLYFLGIGFCGGFTTFSTFTFETLRLAEERVWRDALAYVLLSGPMSFAAAAATFHLTN